MFDMDFGAEHIEISVNPDPSRPPQHKACNIASGCGPMYGGDSEVDADVHHDVHTQALLQNIVHEQAMLRDDVTNDDMSSSDGDEGLEDHQRSSHIDVADLGHIHVGEMKRLIAHHHYCECSICPYRINSRVNEWMMNAAMDSATPGSMYPEQSSGELSMASSMFLDTRPPTPGQLLAEMASWATPVESVVGQHVGRDEYITSPLWLVPEKMVPHQLDLCIPEESEPASDDEL